ncbi:MAG: FtsB family cell division protein [Gaiellaceae bacterium]
MAASARKSSSKPPPRRLKRARRSLSRRLALLGLLLLILALYAKPLHSYLGKRSQLDGTQAEVQQLRAQHGRLERGVARARSAEALTREARRLFYVKPGERLYIVKGVQAWNRAHRR